MSHESVESYYTANFNVCYHKDIGYVNRFTTEILDNMLPYERDIYLSLISSKIEEHNKKAK